MLERTLFSAVYSERMIPLQRFCSMDESKCFSFPAPALVDKEEELLVVGRSSEPFLIHSIV